jgi:UDPglucose--hexose-1-phosphate uridylyltransferase
VSWELRYHPLRQEWVVVAAHRGARPWSGGTVGAKARALPRYAADCYLCPNNVRVSGKKNDDFSGVFVFDNDHPCVSNSAPQNLPPAGCLYQSRPALGAARVVCYTPRHDLTLAELEALEIVELLRTLQAQFRELAARKEVEHVLMFENKGEVVGVSNPHPHCQIYATSFVFKTTEIELAAEKEHQERTGRRLFEDIILAEQQDGRRLLAENDSAIAFLPYFARYAYETYVAPKRSHQDIASLSDSELHDLAAVLKEVLVRFDNLWSMSFPYVMVLHQAPCDGAAYDCHHFHIQFHPPLRGPNLLKYLAGPEVGGGCFITDSAPEEKAAELRATSKRHYRAGKD